MMESDLDELDNLIDSSLAYARFEREQPEPHLTDVVFSEWLEEEVASLRMLGRHLDLQIDHSTLPPGQLVELDIKSMPYAVTNLLRNAFRYAKTRIMVKAEMIGGNILVHVDDDGIGVPVEERERVFSAFSRLDNARGRTTGGYGLGLAIAKQVLEQHGGKSSVADSPLGGARFTLEWPLSQNVT